MSVSLKCVREAAIVAGQYKMTALDEALTTDEADAFEQYHNCELLLLGNARGVDYCGDRIKGTRLNMSPIADRDMIRLREHAAIKKALPRTVLAVLAVACAQQRGDDNAPSDAQAGLTVDKRARHAARAWRRCVVAAIKALAGVIAAKP